MSRNLNQRRRAQWCQPCDDAVLRCSLQCEAVQPQPETTQLIAHIVRAGNVDNQAALRTTQELGNKANPVLLVVRYADGHDDVESLLTVGVGRIDDANLNVLGTITQPVVRRLDGIGNEILEAQQPGSASHDRGEEVTVTAADIQNVKSIEFR